MLFTHAHADHILGLDDLRGFYFINKAPIPCYATKETFKDIEKIFSYIINPSSEYEGGLIAKLSLNEISTRVDFTINELKITPFNLKHGSMNVTGFKFGNLAYATDCNFIPTDSSSLIENIDYLILDGLRYEAHKTHFTITEAIEVSEQLKVKNTYFTHLTHSIEYESESNKLPSNKKFCYDGMEIEFEAELED